MATVVGVGILLVLFCALGIGVWWAIVVFSKDEEEDLDNTFGINFMSGLSEGRALGIEQSVVLGKDNRRIIDFSPRDVRIKDITQIKNVPIITDHNKTITLPKGTFSKDRNINIYLPPNASSFPEPLKKTPFGKMLMLFTEMTNSDNAEIDAFKTGMARQKEHIKAIGAGEVSIRHLDQVTELFQETLDSMKEARKKDDGAGGFTPPRFGGQMGGGGGQ
jgi:hypothetical protein